MSATTPPSTSRRRLRTILRRERETALMTQDQVAIAMDWSLSKVIRIETGTVNISTNDLRALLDLYLVTKPGLRDDLIELARAARLPPWWTEHRESLSSAFIYYLGLEPAASELRFFNNTLMPGLLQTEAYARASILSGAPGEITAEIAEARLAVRMRRQVEVFDQADPPRIMIILDEAAIRRQVGGAQVLSKQLAHLMELSHRPHVNIQVIPFISGVHAGVYAPYIIMDFPDSEAERPILFSEDAVDDDMARERPEVISTYRKSFEMLTAAALDPVASVRFIRTAIDDLWR